MGDRRTILTFPAGTQWTGSGNTANNMTTVSPAPKITTDTEFNLPGVIGWTENESLILDFNVAAISGTANPSIQFLVEMLGSDNVYYPIYSSPVITAAGATTVSIGKGLTTNSDIGLQGRVRWVVAGTNPVITASLVLLGE